MDVKSWLARVAASPAVVLRGSQLTRLWIPEREARDVDHLLLGEWTIDRARATFTPPGAVDEIIWAETKQPGLRITLPDGLQVDLAWGDPLVRPPIPVTVEGVALQGVLPEIMVAWKLHGLFERGRGKWPAKTLADLVMLLRRLKLDRGLLREAVQAAFTSRETAIEELPPDWGTSRGSRHKWKTYRRRAPWVDFTLEEAIACVRDSQLLRIGRPA